MFSRCEVSFLCKVPAFLRCFFFLFELLVQELDSDESSRSDILLDDICRDWLDSAQNMLNSSFHNFVLSIEAVFSVDFLEDFLEKKNLLQEVVRRESQSPSRERADPRWVVLARIGNVPRSAAELWILLAELVGQKTSNILQALSRAVKTGGRIKIFSVVARFIPIWKGRQADVICWNVWFFLLCTLRDRSENLKY